MKRRAFLQTGSAISLPILINGTSLGFLPRSAFFNFLEEDSDRVLVLVQLNGGNDGLNTVIPVDQYTNLAQVRQNILIPENQVLPIEDGVGFHPAMTGMRSMYEDEQMAIVQGVAYPNQNRSHFRSSDIWVTGSAADEFLTTGWMGRYFDGQHPDYPTNYPNPEYPDPFAITLGAIVSETCQGISFNFSMALTDPFALGQLGTGAIGDLPDTSYGHELAYLIESIAQTNAYSEVVSAAAENGSNMSELYEDANRLAQQLKTVALLISGGLKTNVYVVSIGGFDTHANQVTDSPTAGEHANLLGLLSSAITAFQDDLKQLGVERRVLGMTFSEFGRRIRSNDSLGTDHGTAAPLMLFGPCVKSGIVGSNPQIDNQVDQSEGVAMQYDFRSVYGTVLMDWFGATESDVRQLLTEDFQHLPLIEGCEPAVIDDTDYVDPQFDAEHTDAFNGSGIKPRSTILAGAAVNALSVSPNPFHDVARIAFSTIGGKVRISVFNNIGQEVKVLTNEMVNAGSHSVTLDGQGLSRGSYFVRMQIGSWQKVCKLVKI